MIKVNTVSCLFIIKPPYYCLYKVNDMTSNSVQAASSPKLGTLYVISAPSGAGKSSLIQAYLKKSPKLAEVSVSHTTRSPRPGEENGQHYHFVSKGEFKSLINENVFLEWAEVFGNYYGTSLQAINERLDQGIDVFLDIDWQGARQIRKLAPLAKTIFILPPSRTELESRLNKRGQDDADTIAKRMAEAQSEMSHYNEFDYLIINDDFDTALNELSSILLAERCKQGIQTKKHLNLVKDLLA